MSNHLDEYISINSPLNESMSILLKRGVFLLSLSGPGEIDSCKRISFLWWISWGKVFCSLPTMESISPCPTNNATFQGKTCTFWSFISCPKRKNCLIISLKETVFQVVTGRKHSCGPQGPIWTGKHDFANFFVFTKIFAKNTQWSIN